jgi:peptide subunit release factor 1 (eRF1)
MFIVRIDPDEKLDHDRRTLECFECKHEEIRVIKYRDSDPILRCGECKTPMRLTLLEPDGPNSEKATYHCESCALEIKRAMVWRYHQK